MMLLITNDYLDHTAPTLEGYILYLVDTAVIAFDRWWVQAAFKVWTITDKDDDGLIHSIRLRNSPLMD
jgi:hypothetical protein